VWSSTKVEEVEAEIKALAKMIAPSKRPMGGPEAGAVAEWTRRREALMEAKRVEGWRLTLKAHETVALFSRELTVLDCDAPFDMPWEELPVGGFEVEELRALYTKHGFTRKAVEVPSFRKRAPWRLPWVADEGAPAPRARGDERKEVVRDANREQRAPAPAILPPGISRVEQELNADLPPPEAAEDLEERIVRAKIAKSTPLGRKYLVEDLQKGTKYRLRAGVAEALIVELRAKGIAA
jgi:hypothetical protein